MADTYTPNAGMKAAARRALKWKEDGKATGAGTPVGWGRATDIVNGSAISLDTVKRMYSFFSRHEVDKKGKDFNNTSNPSNGRIMWDAWGGDAGFAWSRRIVQAQKDYDPFEGIFSFAKQGPCWDGFVQRGMKPGKDGKQVPNCVPASKMETIFKGCCPE